MNRYSRPSNRASPSSGPSYQLERDLARREPQVALRRATGVSRSAGWTERCSGRSRLTLSRNERIEPVQPIRSANTVAVMSGTSCSSSQTRASTTVNEVCPGARSYFLGGSEFAAMITVVREIPSRCPIRAFGPLEPQAARSGPSPPE